MDDMNKPTELSPQQITDIINKSIAGLGKVAGTAGKAVPKPMMSQEEPIDPSMLTRKEYKDLLEERRKAAEQMVADQKEYQDVQAGLAGVQTAAQIAQIISSIVGSAA